MSRTRLGRSTAVGGALALVALLASCSSASSAARSAAPGRSLPGAAATSDAVDGGPTGSEPSATPSGAGGAANERAALVEGAVASCSTDPYGCNTTPPVNPQMAAVCEPLIPDLEKVMALAGPTKLAVSQAFTSGTGSGRQSLTCNFWSLTVSSIEITVEHILPDGFSYPGGFCRPSVCSHLPVGKDTWILNTDDGKGVHEVEIGSANGWGFHITGLDGDLQQHPFVQITPASVRAPMTQLAQDLTDAFS